MRFVLLLPVLLSAIALTSCVQAQAHTNSQAVVAHNATATSIPTQEPATSHRPGMLSFTQAMDTPNPTHTLVATTAPPAPTLTPTTAPPEPTLTPTTAPPEPTLTPTTAPPEPTLTPTTAPPAPTLTPTTAPPEPTATPEPAATAEPTLETATEEPVATESPPPTEVYVAPASESIIPTNPVWMTIASIGVDQQLVSVGLDQAGMPIVPDHDAAWYNQSAQPGTGENVVLWGHVLRFLYAPNIPAPFERIKELQIGAPITIYNENGQAYTYIVSQQVWVLPEQVEYILPQGHEQLTLVSCIGDQVIVNGAVEDMSHRLITIALPAQ